MIVVDPRWTGEHGIARFATEVVPRLGRTAAAAAGSPSSPLDVVAPWRFPLRSRDVLYSPGFNAGVTRARQIVTLHDLIHLDEPAERSAAKSLYYDLVVRPAVVRAGVVLTVSQTSQHRIRRWLGARSKVEVVDVGNGCSAAFLSSTPTPPPGRGRFLYVGNLKPHKNVDVLFEALSMRPGCSITVVTKDRERVDALAAQHGVTSRVTAVTGLDDRGLAEAYRAHDAVLLPSRIEGFGLPALEGIASGRRVGFSARCDSVREIVGADGVAVAESGAPGAWAEAMDALLAAGPSTTAETAAWRDRYSWDAVASRIGAVLDARAA